MPMNAGDKLAYFEIVGPLGAGGMGEVYRATDTRLKREVAIKLLPKELSSDPERLARLEREAQLLAQLDHPNVAAVYGLEHDGDTRFLVMQLAEGVTIAAHLQRRSGEGRSGGIPLAEALNVSVQIAAGLEAAHAQGIVHRDLKPANLMIGDDGAVKILDFGLAKAVADDGSSLHGDLSASPTMMAATRSGMILGTAGYMSPEQARGKKVDKRTDVWAFGCVLYEMLSGRRVFEGETVSDVMASILKEEPSFDALAAQHGPRLMNLLRRCLAKDPAQRLHDLADARIELAELIDNPEETADLVVSAAAAGKTSLAPWAIAAAAIVFGVWGMFGGTSSPVAERLEIGLPVGMSLPYSGEDAPPVALSADGSTIAFTATPTAQAQRNIDDRDEVLYIRRLDEAEARVVEGSEGAQLPFFSPDGEWIAFFSQGMLRKAPVSGGAVVAICSAETGYGGAWLSNDEIIFTPATSDGLWRVPATPDSTATRITTPDSAAGEFEHDWPFVLPGARQVLFTVWRGGSWRDSDIALLEIATGDYETIQQQGAYPAYVEPGYLVYSRSAELYAVDFDAAAGTTSGTPVAVADGILTRSSLAATFFAISPSGALVYAPGGEYDGGTEAVWLDSEGGIEPVDSEGRLTRVNRAAISPDGTRLAYGTRGENFDLFVYDLRTADLETVSDDPSWETLAGWSPDGQRLLYGSTKRGRLDLFTIDVSGGGDERALLPAGQDNERRPTSWSDNDVITYAEVGESGRLDVWAFGLDDTPVPELIAGSRYNEIDSAISPDGRWVAFASDQSGRYEVRIAPYPPTGDSWQVSSGPGVGVNVWSSDSRTLYYFDYADGRRMMAVRIGEDGRRVGDATPFSARFPDGLLGHDIDIESSRVLGVLANHVPVITWLVVQPNWRAELARRMSEARR